MEESDSLDDPVVEEVDVFLSKSLLNSLYLMQYPLRPKNMSYNHFDHLSARVKPQQKKVELGLALDTRSKNYSSIKGEQIAVNVDGNLPPHSDDRFFKGSRMDKLILSCPPHTKSFSNTQYAIGLLKDKQLHITPMDSIVQMRPNFGYMDKADTRMRNEASANGGEDGGESSQDEVEEEVTPISMKMARAESEEFKARRMASYEYINQKREQERWINLSYFSSDSGLAETERQHLHAGDVPPVSQFKIPAQEYLHALIPPFSEDKSEKPAMPDNVLSLSDLRKLDLNDQIKALLHNVKVIRFSQLISFLEQGTDHQAVLRSLQNMAVLVQGCWVVKSELLYPDDEKSDGSSRRRRSRGGVSPELMRRVRDYAMWKFTHCKYVVRKDISAVVQLPSDDVKEILEKMSRLKARSGWEFLYDYDRDFCDRHPEIVQRQRNKWNLTFHHLAQHFKMPKDGDKKALEMEMILMNQQPPERHRTRRLSARSPRKRTLSGRSQSDLSDMECDTSLDKSQSRERTKSIDGASIRNNVPSDSTKSMTNGLPPPTALTPNGIDGGDATKCNSLKNTTCDNNDGGGGASSSAFDKELKKFLMELKEERLSYAMSDIRNQMSIYSAGLPPGHAFHCGVSDKMIEDAVLALNGVRLSAQWPTNVKPQPMFVFYSGNDKTDKILKVLYSMFQESCRIRTASFRSAVKAESNIDLSDSESKKFLKEHCELAAAFWYLKGALTSTS